MVPIQLFQVRKLIKMWRSAKGNQATVQGMATALEKKGKIQIKQMIEHLPE